MNRFFQKRFSMWVIVVLLVLNVSTLSVMWYKEINKPPRPPQEPAGDNKERIQRFIERELDLSGEQARQFRRLHGAHLKEIKALRDEIRDVKKQQLRTEMFEGEADTLALHQAARIIAEKQFEIERLTFLHFQKLKALVGQDQRRSLRALLDEVFMGQGDKRPPRGTRRRPPEDRP